MEENALLSRQLVETLTEEIKQLKNQIETLKDALRETSLCNVVLFTSDHDISVACVTNGTPEGIDQFTRVTKMFRHGEAMLRKRGVGWAILTDVPVNQTNDSPFLSTSGRVRASRG